MLRDISLWQVLILVGIIVILFGAKRLPDVTRSVGKSLRILKTEVKSLRDEDDEAKPAAAEPEQRPAAQPLEGRAVDEARREQRDEQHRAS
ncbi:Sec-independent protein translocase subunit TatA [uncultured Pseudokineococcus sp.]|uniref:Sec-independent protein translocase subunit TatA n=1 Tax=uncultured Pseudokineococcus sp. TaxID=1642928 RepID=UPI00261217D5|nr:Sec-independent protein translocase subunit TatA [uncultured Pseudokineococcus sp.]